MAIRNYVRATALAVGIAVALAIAACGSDTDDIEERLAAIEVQNAETRVALQDLDDTLRTVGMIAAMGVLDRVGFHHVDVTVQGYTEVDREFLSTLRNARRVTQTTAWPHALQPGADALAAAIEAAEEAFEADDLAALKTTATEAHDRFHALESDANALMDGEEPADHHGDGGAAGNHG